MLDAVDSFALRGGQLRENTIIRPKKPSFARKSDSLTIFAFNQHSITIQAFSGVFRQTREKNILSFVPTFKSFTPS